MASVGIDSSLFSVGSSRGVVDLKKMRELVCRFGKRGGGNGRGKGSFNTPFQLCLDCEGNLVVANTLNFRLQVIDRNTSLRLCY